MKPGAGIAFRIVLVDPPAGVRFRMQQGRHALVDPVRETRGEIAFEFSLRLGEPLPDGRPRFLGAFAQGPPDTRFVYVNSGTSAGDAKSPWTRRAKVPLKSITVALLRGARGGENLLEARIAGAAKDGGPACATVPLLGGAWHLGLAATPAARGR